jgi:ABC-2 type transport system permease protein
VTLAPGSMAWLLRHELRLQWRSARRKLLSSLGATGVLTLLHLVAVPFAFLLPLGVHVPAPLMLASVTAWLWFIGLGMCSRALALAVHAIYERGDMDLLLSSPLAPRSTLTARAIAIAVGLLHEFGSFILPFANVFAAFGHPRWLLAYLVLPALALLSTTFGLWLALLLFRWLGPRRTRVTSQVLAGLLGSSGVVLSQLPMLLPKDGNTSAALQWLAALPDEASWLWWPARAALGDPLGGLIATAAILAAFTLTVRGSARYFIDDVIAAASISTGAPKRPLPQSTDMPHFRTGLQRVLISKELRLLRRDPWLMTQLLQQNIYIVPLMFGLWREATAGYASGWVAVVMAACTIAGALAWLAGSGESAPDLLLSAPIQRRESFQAKLTASLLPVAVGISIPLAILAATHPWNALAVGVASAGGALCCALLNIWVPRPTKSRNLRDRYKSSLLFGLIEFLVMMGWTTVALLLIWLRR